MVTEDRALTVREEQVPSLLVGSPNDRVTQATMVANALAPVIRDKKLFATISGRRHVLFEGWTTLGALMGVFPVTVSVDPIDGGYQAHVEARTLAGAVVGSAIAVCTRSEKSWAGRDDFALMSMAQTRAGSKALRMPLGFIMQLAGYEATPAEEMGVIEGTAREVTTPSRNNVTEKPAAAEKTAWAALYASGKDYGITTQVQMHEYFNVPPEKGALQQYAKDKARLSKITVAEALRRMRDELPERVEKKKELDALLAEDSPVTPEQVSFTGEVPPAAN